MKFLVILLYHCFVSIFSQLLLIICHTKATACTHKQNQRDEFGTNCGHFAFQLNLRKICIKINLINKFFSNLLSCVLEKQLVLSF